MTRATLLLLCLVGLAGCMPAPAKRETGVTTTQSCRAQCNREASVCGDRRQAQDQTGASAGLGAGSQCAHTLEACLSRCGVSR
ncbi:MAG TPA: hypothetical protein VEB20_13155 [Azospirillaceae bacterium]|nr:hypothetical protein [Azospirillaceae bacterium]